jgi:hypothetical protein
MSKAEMKEALNKIEQEWRRSEEALRQRNDSALSEYSKIMEDFAKKHNMSAMYGMREGDGMCGNCSYCEYYDPDLPPEICELLIEVMLMCSMCTSLSCSPVFIFYLF